MTTRIVSVLALLVVIAGCSHKHALPQQVDMGKVSLPAFQGKAVAVHLVEPAVQDQYTGSAGGHSFTVSNVHGYLSFVFGQVSEGSAGVKFVNTNELAGADLEIYPKLEMEYGGALLADCTVRLEMTAKDKTGKVVAMTSGEDSTTFTSMGSGGSACEQTLLTVLGPVVDKLSAAIVSGAAASAP